MQRLAPELAKLTFMTGGEATIHGIACFATRSGYTGEDGFEISVAAAEAQTLARALLAEPEVAPAGLGARDTLRLEAGLCLYGHDIDTTTTPVQAGLTWAIQKVRRPGGERAGGYPGAVLASIAACACRPRRASSGTEISTSAPAAEEHARQKATVARAERPRPLRAS
jgi:aminomethyltransferase